MTPMDTVDNFLSSEQFTALCNEAIGSGGEHAMDLVQIIDMHVDSMTFFAKIDEASRFERELKQLLQVIEYINKIYENN